MPEIPWENDAPGGLGGSAGWVGIKFTVGSDDMAINKLGRWTKYGLTNSSHQVILLAQSGDTMVTNTVVKLPKSAAKKNAWVWGDCYTVVPAGSVVWIVTDAYADSDYYAVWNGWPHYTGADTNIVGSIYGVYTNGVLSGDMLMGPGDINYNNGPVSYQRY